MKTKLLLLLSALVFASCEPTARQRALAVPVVRPTDGSASDVQAKINQSADGDTVTIPAGIFTWTTTVSSSNAITLQGAGAISSTSGGAGLTGTDATTIIDHHPTNEHKLVGFNVPAGKTARLTGIRFLNDSGSVNTQAGMIQIGGGANCIRIDHNHFDYSVNTPGAPSTISVYGGVTGVIDHNYFDQPPTNGPVGVYLQNGIMPGDAAFSAPDDFGTDKFIFMEDNRWRNGYMGDANTGGQRFIYRYNTGVFEFDDNDHISAGYVPNHGITGGRGRSSRAFEYYKNVMSAQPIGLNKSPWPINGGTGLVWGNNVTQYRYVTWFDYTRKNNGTYPYGTPPTGWGNCDGTTGVVWDGPGGGYPCLDQPARGKGDLLSGSFPNIINTRTGNPAQVIQALSPIYVWGNMLSPATGFSPVSIVGVGTPLVKVNREFYQQFGANGESGTFDGTRGVGEGSLSNRPTNCTTGVGYWATDTQTLYVCGANNWVVYYKPYTYPHPLASGGGTSPTPIPTAVPTAAPTATILPTATPAPTATATVAPTQTPTPTAAPSPTPAPTAVPTEPPFGTPAAPSDLTVRVVRGKDVQLSWVDNSDNEVSFEIQRTEEVAGQCVNYPAGITVPRGMESWTDTSTTKRKGYCFKVRALGQNGNNSEWSDTIKVTP